MKPVIKELATKYTDVLFIVIDKGDPGYHHWTDSSTLLAHDGIPHFVFIKDQRKWKEISGADVNGVARGVQQLSVSSASGGHGGASPSVSKAVPFKRFGGLQIQSYKCVDEAGGVGYRRSPDMSDRIVSNTHDTSSLAGVVTGTIVRAVGAQTTHDGAEWIKLENGNWLPTLSPTGKRMFVQVETRSKAVPFKRFDGLQIQSYQCVTETGVGYRRSPNIADRLVSSKQDTSPRAAVLTGAIVRAVGTQTTHDGVQWIKLENGNWLPTIGTDGKRMFVQVATPSKPSLMPSTEFEEYAFTLQGLKSRDDLNGTACIGNAINQGADKPYVVQIAAGEGEPLKLIAVKPANIKPNPEASEIYKVAIALYNANATTHTSSNGPCKIAARLLEEAAEEGNPDAQKAIGICYDKGHGVEQDKEEAYQWYVEAADGGNTEAMRNVGIYLLEGKHVPKNERKACQSLIKAVRRSDAKACAILGQCYQFGTGVEMDIDQALRVYSSAIDFGYEGAINVRHNVRILEQAKHEAEAEKKRVAEKLIAVRAVEKESAREAADATKEAHRKKAEDILHDAQQHAIEQTASEKLQLKVQLAQEQQKRLSHPERVSFFRGKSDGTDSEWSCTSCTFLNASGALECTICLDSRPETVPPVTQATSVNPFEDVPNPFMTHQVPTDHTSDIGSKPTVAIVTSATTTLKTTVPDAKSKAKPPPKKTKTPSFFDDDEVDGVDVVGADPDTSIGEAAHASFSPSIKLPAPLFPLKSSSVTKAGAVCLVDEWLKSIKLELYIDAIKGYGYTTMDDVCDAVEADMSECATSIGMKPVFGKKLVRGWRALVGKEPSTPLSPISPTLPAAFVDSFVSQLEMHSHGDDVANVGVGGFLAMSSRPEGLKLKQTLAAAGNVSELDDLSWEALAEPVRAFIQDEIKEARANPEFCRKQLGLLDTHKDMYADTMATSVKSDPNFEPMTALLDRVQSLVKVRSAKLYEDQNGKPQQRKSDLKAVYMDALAVSARYTSLMEEFSKMSGCSFLQAEPKGLFRCFEKMGLRVDHQWDASCITDVIRGALQMDGALCQGLMFLKVLLGCDGVFDSEGEVERLSDDRDFKLYRERLKELIVITGVKNRWVTPTGGGWCDAMITFYFADDANQHICELQLVHVQMMIVRSRMGAHSVYGVFRTAFELLEAIRSDDDGETEIGKGRKPLHNRFDSDAADHTGKYQGKLRLKKGYVPTESCKDSLLSASADFDELGMDIAAIVEDVELRLEDEGIEPSSDAYNSWFAVLAYTMEASYLEKDEQLYTVLNKSLRLRKEGNINVWNPFIYYFNKALGEFPDVSTTVYKGMKMPANVEKYDGSKRIHWSGYSSTSTNEALARKFAGKGGLVIKIVVLCGKNIGGKSWFGDLECELILSPNMEFVVTKHAYTNGAWTYIELTQIPNDTLYS
jgi:TPR repeat protein